MVMKVEPWGKGQGDHVLIDDDAFDPSFHVPLGQKKVSKKKVTKKASRKK